MLTSRTPAGRLLLVVSAVLCLVLGATALVRLRGPAPLRPGEAAAQDRPGPVVLVPGYGGSTESLTALAGRLQRGGRDASVVALPGGGIGDLRAQADAVEAAVAAALARTAAPSVDLVGYSAGGVVARLWVEEYDGVRRARRVVTLGSPHHGASLAGVAAVFAPEACPQACQQLAPGSDLLDGLNSGDETPTGPAWVSVWTAQDETVTPVESARLAGAVDVRLQSVCADAVVAHGGLPRDPLPVGVVLRALDVVLPVAPSPADCVALRALGAA